MWPAQFGLKLVLGTRRNWPRPRRDRDVSLSRPRRDRDVDNFSRDETETRRWYVLRPSRDRDVETETTTVAMTMHLKFHKVVCIDIIHVRWKTFTCFCSKFVHEAMVQISWKSPEFYFKKYYEKWKIVWFLFFRTHCMFAVLHCAGWKPNAVSVMQWSGSHTNTEYRDRFCCVSTTAADQVVMNKPIKYWNVPPPRCVDSPAWGLTSAEH